MCLCVFVCVSECVCLCVCVGVFFLDYQTIFMGGQKKNNSCYLLVYTFACTKRVLGLLGLSGQLRLLGLLELLRLLWLLGLLWLLVLLGRLG